MPLIRLCVVALVLCAATCASAVCPFASLGNPSSRPAGVAASAARPPPPPLPDLRLVRQDLVAVIQTSQPFWPADTFNGQSSYGPLFVRLAWHCAGTYRKFDGRGGCDGARQRFEPEQSWDDNTNLDKARRLLWPIKQKYGEALSWGDLIMFAGTVAIEEMGGPSIGFCAGRVDDADGSDSVLFGPTPEQEAVSPCPQEGNCSSRLGATKLGLIYVNPEGPGGNRDPVGSGVEVNQTFTRMGFDARGAVALIGGGHAFGKTHGACKAGAGPSPKDDPANPWPGLCANGSVYTSGHEGPWTATPFQWSNLYFRNLLRFNWTLTQSPAGHWQFNTSDPLAPPGIMMLVSDIAFIKHDMFRVHVEEFARNASALDYEFARAWYRLASRDMGPASRCIGAFVPPAQPWQRALPPAPPPEEQPDWAGVKAQVAAAMRPEFPPSPPALDADEDTSGASYYGAAFVKLAWQCAATFRRTDYQGGCNGARVRVEPQRSWRVNAGLEQVLEVLQPVKNENPSLSWSDLIVFAAHVAIEEAAAAAGAPPPAPFCPGRTDAYANEEPNDSLQPVIGDSASDSEYREAADLLGLTVREMVALHGRARSSSLAVLQGYNGSWSEQRVASTFGNEFYKTLLSETWQKSTSNGVVQYKASGKDIFMTPADLNILWMPDLRAAAEEFAANPSAHALVFHSAWSKVMNADRFDGPYANLCDRQPAKAASSSSSSINNSGGGSYSNSQFVGSVVGASFGSAIVASIFTWFVALRRARREKNDKVQML